MLGNKDKGIKEAKQSKEPKMAIRFLTCVSEWIGNAIHSRRAGLERRIMNLLMDALRCLACHWVRESGAQGSLQLEIHIWEPST